MFYPSFFFSLSILSIFLFVLVIFLISVFFFQQDLFYPSSFSFLLKKKSFHFLFNFLLFPNDYYFLHFFFLLGGCCGHPRDFFGTKIYHFSKRKKVPSRVFFLCGDTSPNFDLKNMILSFIQMNFHGKNGPNSPDFQKENSKSSDFYDKFR